MQTNKYHMNQQLSFNSYRKQKPRENSEFTGFIVSSINEGRSNS